VTLKKAITALLVLLTPVASVAQQPPVGQFGIDLSTNVGQAVSANTHLRLMFDGTTLKQSINGGAYGTLGAVGLKGAYNNGVVAADNAIVLTSTLGQVQVKDNSVPLAGTLFSVTDNAGANTYFSVSAAGSTAASLSFLDGSGAGVSAANQGSLVYNNTTKTFQLSNNGAAYTTIFTTTYATSTTIAPATQGATNTTGLTLLNNVADGASSVGMLFEATTAIPSGKVFQYNNGTGAEVYSLLSNFVSTVHELRGANSIFGFRNSSVSGVLAQGLSVFVYANSNPYVQVEAGFLEPDSDGHTALGQNTPSLKRFLGLYSKGPLSCGYNTQAGTTYTVLAGDCYVGFSSSSARTITLVAANAFIPGQWLIIDDQSGAASTGNITINRAGADTIDGGTSTTIVTNNGDKIFISDGVSKWFTIAKGL
jgi:hypothetical protein